MDEGAELIPENLRRPADEPASTSKKTPTSIKDYNVIKEIGEGSISTVYYAKEMFGDRREVAVKSCQKRRILRDKLVDAVMREKNILARLSTAENMHSFVVGLYCTLQDAETLFFVVSYAQKGDLATIIQKLPEKRMTFEQSRFYSAELLAALGHIHWLEVIHRDVKPDNILVKADGHILLSDFGSAKDRTLPEKEPQPDPRNPDGPRKRRASFVGTAPYVTPEMLQGKEADETCDFWALGVTVFQFLTGKHCFHDESEYLIFRRVQELLYKFPDDFPATAKSLVEALLVVEPSERLGSAAQGGISSLKQHDFFDGVQWDSLENTKPPFLI
ncbi:unnamed protein product, partial [Mesorhabditis spiculigera]